MEQSNFKVTKENYKELIGKIIKHNISQGILYYKVTKIMWDERNNYFTAAAKRIWVYYDNSIFPKENVGMKMHLGSTYRIAEKREILEAIDYCSNMIKEIIK